MTKPLRLALSAVVGVNFYTGLLNFAFLIYFARTLGLEVLADYALVLLGIELSFLALNFGFNQVLIYQGQSPPQVYAAVFWGMASQTLLIATASVVLWLGYSAAHEASAARLLVPGCWLLLARLIGLWSTLALVPFEVSLRQVSVSIIRALAATSGCLIGAVAAALDQGLYALLYRDLLNGSICLLAGLLFSGLRLSFKTSKDALGVVFRYTRRTWALNLLERASLRIEYLMIASILGRETLGAYFALRSVVEGLLGFVVVPIQTVVFAYYCQTDLKRRIVPILRFALVASVGVALPLVPVGLMTAEQLVVLVLGQEYAGAAPALIGLIVYGVSVVYFENAKVLSMSHDRHSFAIFGRIAYVLLLLLGLPIAVTALGLLGAGVLLAGAGIVLMAIPTALLLMFSRRSRV